MIIICYWFIESLKGGKKSNGSNDQKVDMLVRCQPCQRIFASMEAMRAHQKVGQCYIVFDIWSYLKFVNLEIYFPFWVTFLHILEQGMYQPFSYKKTFRRLFETRCWWIKKIKKKRIEKTNER